MHDRVVCGAKFQKFVLFKLCWASPLKCFKENTSSEFVVSGAHVNHTSSTNFRLHYLSLWCFESVDPQCGKANYVDINMCQSLSGYPSPSVFDVFRETLLTRGKHCRYYLEYKFDLFEICLSNSFHFDTTLHTHCRVRKLPRRAFKTKLKTCLYFAPTIPYWRNCLSAPNSENGPRPC